MFSQIRQRGEVALSLALITLIISFLGIGLGAASLSKQQTHQASADEFPYEATLEIRNEGGDVINAVDGLNWQNNFATTVNKGKINTNGKAFIHWKTASLSQELRNRSALITITPGPHTIVNTFCEDEEGSTCDNIFVTADKRSIGNLRLMKNARVRYGWIVQGGARPNPTVVPNPTAAPNPTALPPQPGNPAPTSQPAPEPFHYSTSIELRDSQTRTILDYEDPMTYRTQIEDQTFTGKIKTGEKAEITLNSATMDPAFRDKKAKAILSQLPDTYIIEATFCEDIIGTACLEATQSPDMREIHNIRVQPGASIKYGWVLRRSPANTCQLKVPECKPQNVRVSEIRKNSVKVTWDKPTNCLSYRDGVDPFWVDISTDINLVCSATTTSNSKVCTLGVDADRLVEKNTEEWRNASWKVGTYHANVYLAKPNTTSCISDASLENFTYADPAFPGCQHIEGTGNYRIVFTSNGIGDYPSFEQYVRNGIEQVRKTNLGDIFKKFTFVADPDMNRDYQCKDEFKADGSFDSHTCDGSVDDIKSLCHANAAIIAAQSSHYSGYTYRHEDTNKIVLSTYNLGDQDHLAVPHEMGHAIADLYDEYVYPADERPGNPDPDEFGKNCTASTDTTCTKWKTRYPNAKCNLGCTYALWYRPSDISVMGSVPTQYNTIFNEPSMEAWVDAMKEYSGFSLQSSDQHEGLYHNSMHLQVQLGNMQSVALAKKDLNLSTAYVYPQSRFTPYASQETYVVEIKNAKGHILYETHVPKARQKITENSGIQDEKVTELDLYLPYFAEATDISITDSAKGLLQSLRISDYDLAPPLTDQNLCGNSVCDAGIGETQTSCRVDCGAHLEFSEVQRADLDKNGIVNGQDLSYLSSEDVYGVSDKGDVNGDGKTDVLDFTILLKWLGERVP